MRQRSWSRCRHDPSAHTSASGDGGAHLSQLDCALDADISQRHLSFIESGRAAPSRGMVLHLAEALDVPLRERNTLLLAAGFAISRTAIGHAGAKASARRH
jgi:transcriptional regulator with XRE-family HTH domain